MTTMTRLSALAAAAVALAAVTACSEDDDQPDALLDDGPSVAADEPFNGADVQFASEMIQHHAEALTMVDLTRERDLTPEVQQLADQILTAQAPEIEQMTDWLTEWDQPVPETMRDHVNADGHGELEGGLAELEDAPDAEFEELWLETMVEHHEDAVEMAQAEQDEGEYADTVALAETIESTQQDEIDTMEGLLP